MNTKVLAFIYVVSMLTLLSSCAQLERHVKASKPTATLVGTRLLDIDFEKADIIFDLAVKNDNPFSIRIAGLDYDLKIGGHSLISGITGQGIKVKKSSTSKVALPLTLKFDDLKKIPGEIWKRDQFNYQLESNINIKLPVIGNYAVPFSKKGSLPVPKLPTLRLQKLAVKNLNLTSADIIATVEVDNPNSFKLALSQLNYRLDINQQNWGRGATSKLKTIQKKRKGSISIPFQLNFLNMGKAAYQAIVAGKPLDYHLRGDVSIDTGLDLLQNYKMPLDIRGTTSIK